MGFDIYGNRLRVGHCEVHPHVHQEYPCDVCLSERRSKPQPIPLCDICGKHEAVSGYGPLGLCSQECENEAIRRESSKETEVREIESLRAQLAEAQRKRDAAAARVATYHDAMRTEWREMLERTEKAEAQLAKTRADWNILRKERDALVAILVSLFDWSDTTYSHAVMHVENAVRNLIAERAAEKARADRLEAAIRDAPHDEDCRDNAWHMENCNCWKREALEGK